MADVVFNYYWNIPASVGNFLVKSLFGNGLNYKTGVFPSLDTAIQRRTLNLPIGLVHALYYFV